MRFQGGERIRTNRENPQRDIQKPKERSNKQKNYLNNTERERLLKKLFSMGDSYKNSKAFDDNLYPIKKDFKNKQISEKPTFLNTSYNFDKKFVGKENKGICHQSQKREKRFNINRRILDRIYNQLKENNWSYPKINDYIGADFKNIRHRGISLTESSLEKLQELIEWEIPYNPAQKTYSRNQNKIFVTKLELKSVLDDLKLRGTTHNDVSSLIGPSIINAYHLGLGIPEFEFEKLEKLAGRKIPIKEKKILIMNQKGKGKTKVRDRSELRVIPQKEIKLNPLIKPELKKEDNSSPHLDQEMKLIVKPTENKKAKPSSTWNPKVRRFSQLLSRIIREYSKRPIKYRISPSSVHKGLNVEYFEKINTKEKAYWLGFLYADGCVYEDSRNSALVLQLKIHKKDEHWVDKFIETIGANKQSKRYEKNTVKIRIGNKKMCIDLIKHGCVPRKSNIIEFPNSKTLSDEKLALAFLLGFYDGDGVQNRTRLVTGSNRFLKQIKMIFGLNNKILKRNSHGDINGRKIHGVYYEMSIGSRLFNKLMKNFKNSMTRKRND